MEQKKVKKNKGKIIFHIPYDFKSESPSGSSLRPAKMLEAFNKIGYEVDTVIGTVKERKKAIRTIKEKVRAGEKYNFIYSESSSLPTALTESHHLPLSPFMDYFFFNYIKKNNIPLGLFYRDIFWRFKSFEQTWYKKYFSLPFYYLDLWMYRKFCAALFLPSLKMLDYIPLRAGFRYVYPLPPGIKSEMDISTGSPSNGKPKKILYIGGLGKVYDLELFIATVKEFNDINFILMTREKNYMLVKERYKRYQTKNIQILMDQTMEKMELYNSCDIACLFVEPKEYWSFAMPYKLFEYIQYGKPILASASTLVGDFINENNIGWAIEYNKEALRKFFKDLMNGKIDIKEKRENIIRIKDQHTWEKRAQFVAEILDKRY